MSLLFANNASTTLASGISSGATSLTVASGKGALFPTISGGNTFNCTLANAAGTVEIVSVTARSADTFTIVRAQDGTSAAAWNTGDVVELRVTAGDMNGFAQTGFANTFTGVQSFTNPSITNYTETPYVPAANSAFTVSLANGTLQQLTTNANVTITLPAPVAGHSYTIQVAYGGTHTVTWAGGGTIKWAGGVAPVATSVNGKFDVYVFFCVDGTNTFGQDGGRNF